MQEQLRQISAIFFQDTDDYAAIQQACAQYKDLLLQVSDINLSGRQERENITLACGEALGATWAAYCLDDFLRTKKFIKGTREAVDQVLKQNTGRPVHLLYAGTGPFASLILPLTCIFSPDQLQFTLIEINPISYRNVEQLLTVFNLEKYIRHSVAGDATQYEIPVDEQVDIILSETMQAGLRKEAQVPIFYHFLAQNAAHEALIIPQRVQLYLGLWKSHRTEDIHIDAAEKTRVDKFGCYFELSKQRIQLHLTEVGRRPENLSFPAVCFSFPAHSADFDKLAIFTEIDIFAAEKLTLNQSGLTIPLMIRDLMRHPPTGERIQIAYSLTGTPGEITELIN